LNATASSCGCKSDDAVLVFILNFLSRPRARSLWPEPNGLLALPNENQTLCCERVLRQETTRVHIFGIGTIELRILGPSSCAQLPLHSCVDCAKVRAKPCRRVAPRQTERELRLRSLFGRTCPQSSGTVSRLKDRRNSRAGIETESFYSGLDSEEFCFNGGRCHPRGRVYRISQEEFQEKELVPSDRRASRLSGWRNY